MTPKREAAPCHVLYNELDPFVAEWLENLADRGLISPGLVDRRSIRDLRASELIGYQQIHFFAGIGGWSYALRLAGWPEGREVWTGSCPCQPLSAAGNRKGKSDDRHLWPAWFQLIRRRRPATVFGEQVASPAGLEWFDSVRSDLEGEGYAVGAADQCAANVGAPHQRQRIFWVADADGGQPRDGGSQRGREHGQQSGDGPALGGAWDDVEWITCTDGKARPVERGVLPFPHGLPHRLDRLRVYGNAIVPQVAARFVTAYMETRGIVADSSLVIARPNAQLAAATGGRPESAQYGAPHPNAVVSSPDITAWLNKITCGDAVAVMNQMPPESVGLVVCSPPYNLRNSSGNGMRGGGGGRWKSAQLLHGYDTHGDDLPHDEYVAWQRECLTAMLRVLRPDGAIFYNHKARVQRGLLQDPSEILDGFPVRQRIVWQRSGGFNFNESFFVPTHELVYVICKSRAFKLAPKANRFGDVWQIPQERNSDHPAPFPVELARRCIGSTTANLILDPFMGSGTTAIAAEELKRNWIGIEISESYCEAARRRIDAARALASGAEGAPTQPPHASHGAQNRSGANNTPPRDLRVADPGQVNQDRHSNGGMEDVMSKKVLASGSGEGSSTKPQFKQLRTKVLRLDGGTQARKELDRVVIHDYAEKMRAGVDFPPVVVFFDGTHYWLADGFHRVEAAIEAGRGRLKAEIHKGTRRDALLHAVGANDNHGRQRTNADKRRAVELLLADEEYRKWSDREIARRCLVSQTLVSNVRSELTDNGGQSEEGTGLRRYVTRHGTQAVMNTANINGSRGARSAESDSDGVGVVADSQSLNVVETEAASGHFAMSEVPAIAPGVVERTSFKPANSCDQDAQTLWQARQIKTRRANERRAEREARRAESLALKHPLRGERYRLIIGDLENAARDLEDGSVDAIVTDPPYEKECLGSYAGLGRLATRVLKPGGHLVVMIGQAHMPQILHAIASAGPELMYVWTIAYLTPSKNTQVFDRRVASSWKPVLWFTKGRNRDIFIGDVVRPTASNDVVCPPADDGDKLPHEWGQSVGGFRVLLERFTLPGELVLDPFCGGGTTGAAALELARLFVGIDIDEAAVKETAKRLSEVTMALAGSPPPVAASAPGPTTTVPSGSTLSEQPATISGTSDGPPPSTTVSVAPTMADSPSSSSSSSATTSPAPFFVGVAPGPLGYAAMIDSDGEVISCTPAPTTGETCDAQGVARLVKSWVEAGVAKVVIDEPAVDGLGKAACVRVLKDYGMWIEALSACRQPHEATPSPWRDPECGWDELLEATKAFPGVDLRAVERSDHRVSKEKAQALLIARYAWKLHSTVLGQDGGGLAGFQPRRRRKPRASASCE